MVMMIVPSNVQKGKHIRCAVCGQPTGLPGVMPGALGRRGRQALACDMHVRRRAAWIVAWVDWSAIIEAGGVRP